MQVIVDLVKQDPLRVAALDCVYQRQLPQCYVAAGFVRNLVWDWLHQKVQPTLLSDVDVVYFEQSNVTIADETAIEQQLSRQMPQLNWQVKNQARMHLCNGDHPYQSTLDAMSYWPEYETAVAIRKIAADHYECISAFGFESLLQGWLTPNPKRCFETFAKRRAAKGWLDIWPQLRVSQHERSRESKW